MSIRIAGSGYRREKPWNVWLTLGMFLVIGALWGLWSGIEAYREELTQVDWPTTQATVVQVEVLRERSTRVKNPTYYDYYNVTYEYVVNGKAYTEVLEHRNVEASMGDTFPVKYNPQAPEQSNHILEPSTDYIWFNVVLCVVGIAIVVLSVRRKKPRTQEP